MKASEFVSTYAKKGQPAWERAALDSLLPVRWVKIPLSDDRGNTGEIYVSDDYLRVGEPGDAMLLPLTPERAQDAANREGALLPTPWLVYRIWQESQKLERHAMQPNKGPNLAQYAEHSSFVDQQVASLQRDPARPLSGHKKDVVVSNAYKPGKVIIYGWYKPSPDVYNDGSPWTTPNRQPQQALSNFHYDGYADYSHGIRLIHPIMKVNGRETPTEDVYTSPTLSRLVSNEGPVRVPRYPSKVNVPLSKPTSPNLAVYPVPNDPSYASVGLKVMVEQALARR